MNIMKMQGMRYPSESIVRFFYKEGLSEKSNGKMIELGCGTANHLMFFAANGWEVTGVDYDLENLRMARNNLDVSGMKGDLVHHDLTNPLPNFSQKFDALLAPSSLYYLNRELAKKRLIEINQYLNHDAIIYLRMRLADDHRFGRGEKIDETSWQLNIKYTNEFGLLNVFWSEYELVELFSNIFDISLLDLIIIRTSYETKIESMIIRNSDIEIWGRKK
jgi:SAM-dependent methyltransferase